MTRNNLLIGAGVAVLLVVLFWLFLWQPANDDIAALEEQIEQAETRRATVEARIDVLEDIRARAPEIEAALVAAESVIPRDAAYPALIRQIAQAADDAGITVAGVQPERPQPFSEEIPELAQIPLSIQVEGSYFQVVDFFRRLEDPAIVPRGFVWANVNVTGDSAEYPTLQVSGLATVFAILPAPPAPAPPEGEQPPPADGASPAPSPSPTEDGS